MRCQFSSSMRENQFMLTFYVNEWSLCADVPLNSHSLSPSGAPVESRLGYALYSIMWIVSSGRFYRHLISRVTRTIPTAYGPC